MRSIWLALFILVAPLPLEGVLDDEMFDQHEVVLQLPEGEVWSQSGWMGLGEFNYVPLRLLTPSALVAWKVSSDAHHPIAAETKTSDVVWKSYPSEGQSVRLVFEPGLPDSAVVQLHDQVQRFIGSQQLHFESGHLTSVTIQWDTSFQMDWFAELEGVLWIEPQLKTEGRNFNSAQLLTGAEGNEYPSAWNVGLNGKGVVIGVADTGIDSDHTCFRNLSSVDIGLEHRKLLYVNTSIDGWDSSGHADYRHGTHTAGILGCHPLGTATEENLPPAYMAIGYETQLVVQDIVSEEGWLPPDVDLLLAESAMYGGYLHSNSWGDDTTDYTLRSGDFDAFTREFPWTLPLIAPGNNGGFVLEPANARNVIAIGASTKDTNPERWMSSVHGPTDADTRGIFALAPGVSIVSARSDGMPDSYNAGQHTLSGTSMSTPMAASYASIVQQMVQDGWLTGHNETLSTTNLGDMTPWFGDEGTQKDILLGEGFTPSAPMMKALLSLSTTPLDDSFRNGGDGGSAAPNSYDGWGVFNLEELLNIDQLRAPSTEEKRPVENIWIHDSYRLLNDSPSNQLATRMGTSGPIENLMQQSWDGSGSVGPFLSTGDVFQQRFILQGNESLDVRLAIQAKPEPHLVDDVQLMVRLPDGRFALGEQYRQDGRSMLYYDFADHLNTSAFPSTNETTVGIYLDESTLSGIDYVDVVVSGRYVTPGNNPGTLGVEGDRIGFGLAVKGVELDPLNHSDADGDDVPYEQDSCPFTNAIGWDIDQDGCIDDVDEDGVEDNQDDCLSTHPDVPVTSSGCAQQNQAPRIFVDEVILQAHDNETISLLFSVLDSDNVSVEALLDRQGPNPGTVSICERLVINDSWQSCSVKVNQDFFPLSPGGNWTVVVIAQDMNSSWWTSPELTEYESETFEIFVPLPAAELSVSSVSSWFSIAVIASIVSAILLGTILQRWISEEID